MSRLVDMNSSLYENVSREEKPKYTHILIKLYGTLAY